MNNARVGKIARLPAAIRYELNRRLENGVLGKDIVPWLNALPEVQRVLTEMFGGQPISENNLSNWRRGGFQDWLRDQERRARLEELWLTVRQASCLSPSSSEEEPQNPADNLEGRMQQRVIVELAEQLERLATVKDPAERFKRLIRLSREVCRVQKARIHALEVDLHQAKAADFVQLHSTPIRPV
ncbi:MAG TPA: hypothetical protein VH597_09855 [Verrucomicrobiae bacterium]|jgi:hypothetical protein|nr:hypothetical protein [Verrucomicrobiae bacterium]